LVDEHVEPLRLDDAPDLVVIRIYERVSGVPDGGLVSRAGVFVALGDYT
jgi:hypothetical protein